MSLYRTAIAELLQTAELLQIAELLQLLSYYFYHLQELTNLNLLWIDNSRKFSDKCSVNRWQKMSYLTKRFIIVDALLDTSCNLSNSNLLTLAYSGDFSGRWTTENVPWTTYRFFAYNIFHKRSIIEEIIQTKAGIGLRGDQFSGSY